MDVEQKKTFKLIYGGLTEGQKNYLMSAFDKMESCYIEYEKGKFIGCHCNLLAIAKSEYWSYGEL